MHHYRMHSPHELDLKELKKLVKVATQFEIATFNVYDPPTVMAAMTMDEVGTITGITQMMMNDESGDNFMALRKLQAIDLMTDVLKRVDPALAQSCVPPAMSTAAIADLLKKYELPAMESLSRTAINPAATAKKAKSPPRTPPTP